MRVGPALASLDLGAFERDGALLAPALFDAASLARLAAWAADGPGARLAHPDLPEQIAPATAFAARLLAGAARPVRAVMFDKTASANWAVTWHQDRTIAVRERAEVAGFGPWSRKHGLLHVAPPAELLGRMATLRIHIDPVGPDNAPLRVAIGSHRLGMVPAAAAAARAATAPNLVCLADPGDVWAYRTLVLHASDRAAVPGRRRVLQVDYAAEDLPAGLQWAGVA